MIVSWNWLNEYVPLKVTPAELAERLMMAGLNHEGTEQLGDDWAIDLEVTSNRPDCLGHIGIAREAAVLFGLPLKFSDAELPRHASRRAGSEPPRIAEDLRNYTSVDVACPELCPRYTARVIRGVKVGPSPSQMAVRLATIGQPVINNIVDITNYVLMECGQPLHAFDFQKLAGRKIIVRRAKAGEQFRRSTTRRTRSIPRCASSPTPRRPVALGGVMGGADTRSFAADDRRADRSGPVRAAVDPRDGPQAQAAQPLVVSLRARHRSGKGRLGQPPLLRADPEARRRRAGRRRDRRRRAAPQRPADHAAARPAQADPGHRRAARSGAARFSSPSAACEQAAGAREVVTIPPSWRRDLAREIDLVEEVARIHGYDKIPEDVSVPMAAFAPARQRPRAGQGAAGAARPAASTRR